MKSKEKIMKVIKQICLENKGIGLKIVDSAASWAGGNQITATQWKQIGYVSAYAFAYDIKEYDPHTLCDFCKTTETKISESGASGYIKHAPDCQILQNTTTFG